MRINPKFWNILDWSMVIILTFLCFLFVADCIRDYISRRSSFAVKTLPIKEQPSVSICFGETEDSLWDRDSYDLNEIDIIYYNTVQNNYSKIILKLGDNVSPDFPGEIITLRKMQRCFSILVKSDGYQHKRGRSRFVKVAMKQPHDFSKYNRPPPAYFYLTDQANAYGTENKKFFEGKEFSVKVYPDAVAFLTIRPKITKILKEKTNCRKEQFWTTFEPIFVFEVNGKCSNPCFPQGLPNETLAICEAREDWECANQAMKKLLKNGQKVNTGPPCSKLEYGGSRLNQYYRLENLANDQVCNKI